MLKFYFLLSSIIFIVNLILFFIIFLQNKKIKSLSNLNFDLIEKNEELLNNNQFLKEKIDFLDFKFQSVYNEINNEKNPASKIDINQDQRTNKTFILNLYSDFILKLKDEIERKKRYSFFSFTVLRISVDFFSEYSSSYGLVVEDFINDLKINIPEIIRKIDFFAESKSKEVIFALLPMTELDGAVILAKRIQDLAKDLSINKLITLTISICQPEECMDITQLIKTLIELSASGEESGGNIIKVKKI